MPGPNMTNNQRIEMLDRNNPYIEQKPQPYTGSGSWNDANHREKALKWADKHYGGKYDFGYYLTGKRTKGLIQLDTPEGASVFWNAKNQYDYGNGKYLYANPNINPYTADKTEIEAMNSYLKDNGYEAFQPEKFKQYYTREAYKDKYENSDEDRYNRENGLLPKREQISRNVLNELQRLQSAMDAGTLTPESAKSLAPTVTAITNDTIRRDSEAQRASERERAKMDPNSDSYDPNYVPKSTLDPLLYGTKEKLPYDTEFLKQLGWNEKYGFAQYIDPVRWRSGDERPLDQQVEQRETRDIIAAKYNQLTRPRPVPQAQQAAQPVQPAQAQPLPLIPRALPTGAPLSQQGRQKFANMGQPQQTMRATPTPKTSAQSNIDQMRLLGIGGTAILATPDNPGIKMTTRAMGLPGEATRNALNMAMDAAAGKQAVYDPNLSFVDMLHKTTDKAQFNRDAMLGIGNPTVTNLGGTIKYAISTPWGAAAYDALGSAVLDPTTYVGAETLNIAKLAKAGKAAEAAAAAKKLATELDDLKALGKLDEAITPGAKPVSAAEVKAATRPMGAADTVPAVKQPATPADWSIVPDRRTGELTSVSPDGQFAIRAAGGKFRLYEFADEGGRTVVKPRGQYDTLQQAQGAVDNATNARSIAASFRNPAASPVKLGPARQLGEMPQPFNPRAARQIEVARPVGEAPRQITPNTLGPARPLTTTPETAAHKSVLVPGNGIGIVPEGFDETVGGLKKVGRSLYRTNVSGVAPLERASKMQALTADVSIADRIQAVRDAGGRVDNILSRGFSPKAGGVTGKSWRDVVRGIPEKDLSIYNEYRQNLHNIPRQAEGKPVLAKTIKESQERVAEIGKQHPEFVKHDRAINNFNDDIMNEYMVGPGKMLSREQYQHMKTLYPDYIPTLREEYQELGRFGAGSSDGFGNRIAPRGVKRATGATSKIVPLQDAFAINVNRMIRSSAKNDLYLDLMRWAETNPVDAAPYVKIKPADEAADIFKNGVNGAAIDDAVEFVDKEAVKQVKKGLYELTAYDNGKAITGQVSKEVYDAIQFLNGNDVPEWLRWTMDKAQRLITNPFKTLTTGVNAEFWARNVIRDMPTAFAYSQEGNLIKYAAYHKKAVAEMATKGDLWKLYQSMGGNRSGFYNVEKGFVASGKKTLTGAIGKGAEAVGNTLEAEPRFTEFLIGLDKHGNTPAGRLKAMTAAADVTVNFSRTSPVSKVLNAFVPYYNAGVQGLDKFFRAMAGSSPVRAIGVKAPATLLKAGTATTPFAIALYAWNSSNPYYKELDNRTRDNNWVIPNIGNLDENGYAKTFFKIPKNREIGTVFASFFERLGRTVAGEKDPFKGFEQQIVNNFLPPNPVDDNILASPWLQLRDNKDFAGRPIVPDSLKDLDPELQYDAKTSEVAKFIGQRFKVSPLQVDYVLAHYGGGIADTIQKATTGGYGGVADALYKTFVEPWRVQFTADPVFNNQTMQDFYENLDQAVIRANSRHRREGIDAKASTPEERARAKMQDASTAISDLKKQEQEVLGANLTQQEKNAQIRALREQAIQIARDALGTYRAGESNQRIYPAGVDDQKRDAYDKIVQAGVSEEKMQDIFKMFGGLKPKPGNKTVTVADRKLALRRMVQGGKLTERQYSAFVRNYYPKGTD